MLETGARVIMAKFVIQPNKTAHVIIDMINSFLIPDNPLEIPNARQIIPRLNRVISTCRKKGILNIFITHEHRKDGSDLGLFSEFVPEMRNGKTLIEGSSDVDIYPEMDRKKVDLHVAKRTFSAFYATDLDLLLRINNINTLIISGVATHSCCEATARDARHRNYRVLFLSDGTATYDILPDMGWGEISGEDVQKFVLTTLALRGAEVLSVEELLQRLSEF
jgi:ureidoacrylate peracid hydrolase